MPDGANVVAPILLFPTLFPLLFAAMPRPALFDVDGPEEVEVVEGGVNILKGVIGLFVPLACDNVLEKRL